jgi:hypothetical protein
MPLHPAAIRTIGLLAVLFALIAAAVVHSTGARARTQVMSNVREQQTKDQIRACSALAAVLAEDIDASPEALMHTRRHVVVESGLSRCVADADAARVNVLLSVEFWDAKPDRRRAIVDEVWRSLYTRFSEKDVRAFGVFRYDDLRKRGD